MEVKAMNRKIRFQIENAVWQAQRRIHGVCLVCGSVLNMLDAQEKCAVCWGCRRRVWPLYDSLVKAKGKGAGVDLVSGNVGVRKM